jgi:FAD/FMN-containing dehydrogenase
MTHRVDRPGADFEGVFRDDVAARAVYAEAAGIGRVIPQAVAVPANADDVVRLVRWAHDVNVALVPRASGSSMPGGAIGHGVILDLSRLDAIGEPDRAARRIVVGPGAIRNRVDSKARTVGLRFPVDPSSGAFCSIGGMVSTNAAGARTLRFGSTRRWVHSLDCVFADGSRATVRRGEAPPRVDAVTRFLSDVAPDVRAAGESAAPRGLRKNSSGYALAEFAASGELVDVIVGNEGTLAIIVGIELALAELPGATASLLASYASLDVAVVGADVARRADASACELLDRTFLDVAARGAPLPVPEGTEAVLLIELEAESAGGAAASARDLAARLEQRGATAVAIGLDLAEEERLWALRHAASPILSRLDPSLKSMQFIEDGVVPPARLADYVRGVRAALVAHNVPGVIFGHAGDAHVHVNPLVDVRRDGWRDRVAGILADVVDLTAKLGGSLSGEHGDGALRAPLLDHTTPPVALDLARRVKHAFDPDGILNPGVKVPLPNQRALGDIKYDPSLPALPPAAARVLDRVERDRAYAEFRLAMLEREELAE